MPSPNRTDFTAQDSKGTLNLNTIVFCLRLIELNYSISFSYKAILIRRNVRDLFGSIDKHDLG